MQSDRPYPRSFDTTGRVRQNAGSAAFAAALMLYFGFVHFDAPTVTDMFSRCSWLWYHTMRFGGGAMALIAAWSWTGHRPVLLVDAIVSTAIGAVFISTGAGMLIDGGGGLNSLLLAVFGAMFISAGVRNGRDYLELRGRAAHAGDVSYDPHFERRYEEARAAPGGASLASQLLERAEKTPEPRPPASRPSGAPADTRTSAPDPAPTTPDDAVSAPSDRDPTTDETATPPDAPPGGFLASFAKDEPPDE